MGCETSKTKDSKQAPSNENRTKAANTTANNDAAKFLSLANVDKHPVARELLKEWTVFVDAQDRKLKGDDSAAKAYDTRAREIWAESESLVTHRSVAEVGEAFMAFLGQDLTQRGWGGNFNYLVAGVAKQGFLRVSVNVEPAPREPPEEVIWEVKIHYHSHATS